MGYTFLTFEQSGIILSKYYFNIGVIYICILKGFTTNMLLGFCEGTEYIDTYENP